MSLSHDAPRTLVVLIASRPEGLKCVRAEKQRQEALVDTALDNDVGGQEECTCEVDVGIKSVGSVSRPDGEGQAREGGCITEEVRVCYLEQRKERAFGWPKSFMTTENARVHSETQMSKTIVEEMGEQANRMGEGRETRIVEVTLSASRAHALRCGRLWVFLLVAHTLAFITLGDDQARHRRILLRFRQFLLYFPSLLSPGGLFQY